MPEMLTLEAFEEASEKVKEVTLETKLIESPYLSAATGNRMWLKPENMQRTGAYKLRGAYYKISKLSQEELDRGVITASAGNHAQGVAYAATHAGARSIVVMPTTTPPFVSGGGGVSLGITLGYRFNFKQTPHFFIKSSPS